MSSPDETSEPGDGLTDGDVSAERERTPYTPDAQSLKVLLGALVVGALIGVGLLLLILLT